MTNEEFEALRARHGAATIIEALTPYLTEARQERIAWVLNGRLRSIHVAVEQPYDPHNAAAIVRSAEAFGARSVHVIDAHPASLRARKTTSGSHRWIETRAHADLEHFFAHAGDRGMIVAAACVDPEEVVDLDELPLSRPICVLFGNEHAGLTKQAKAMSEVKFRIPTFGFVESLNLSVSAAVTLHSLTSRWRLRLGKQGDLEPAELEIERARYFVHSVDDRLIRGLLQPGAPAGRSGSRGSTA